MCEKESRENKWIFEWMKIMNESHIYTSKTQTFVETNVKMSQQFDSIKIRVKSFSSKWNIYFWECESSPINIFLILMILMNLIQFKICQIQFTWIDSWFDSSKQKNSFVKINWLIQIKLESWFSSVEYIHDLIHVNITNWLSFQNNMIQF